MAALAAASLAIAPAALRPAVAAANPPAAQTAACPGATLRPDGADGAAVDTATLCLVDRIRAAHGLRTLRANRYLQAVAASQVATMLRWDYFSDVRPGGVTPLSLVGVTRYPSHAASFSVGQNIAWGTSSFATPQHIVAEWMASAPHRAIILASEFRDAGVAVRPGIPYVLRAGHSGATYAMEFGRRR